METDLVSVVQPIYDFSVIAIRGAGHDDDIAGNAGTEDMNGFASAHRLESASRYEQDIFLFDGLHF